jgi:uncharacterized membrane protein YvlD (DUF360 family)
MAENETEVEQFHYWGVGVLGFLGSGVIWLTIGEGRIVWVAWMVISGGLVVAMLLLPERAARSVRAVCYAFGLPAGILLTGLMALVPGALAYTFSRTIVETFPRWLQVGMLLAWFLLLAMVSMLLYSRALRRGVREWLRTQAPEWLQSLSPPDRVEAWGAVALYINFVIIAMGCFASIAFLLHGLSPPLFLPAVREVDHGALADFLLWQLLDAIPGLKVPETIRWVAPLTYERSGAGWLVLLFKVMVIVPVVSGIGHYLKDEEPPGVDSPSTSSGAEARPRGA